MGCKVKSESKIMNEEWTCIIQMVCLRQHIVLCKSTGQKQIFIPMFDTCSGFSKKKVGILFECHVTIF